jgi:hypothetical protein
MFKVEYSTEIFNIRIKNSHSKFKFVCVCKEANQKPAKTIQRKARRPKAQENLLPD